MLFKVIVHLNIWLFAIIQTWINRIASVSLLTLNILELDFVVWHFTRMGFKVEDNDRSRYGEILIIIVLRDVTTLSLSFPPVTTMSVTPHEGSLPRNPQENRHPARNENSPPKCCRKKLTGDWWLFNGHRFRAIWVKKFPCQRTEILKWRFHHKTAAVLEFGCDRCLKQC